MRTGAYRDEPGKEAVHGQGQKQLYTAAAESTSGRFVIGSAITKASNRRLRAYQILELMAPRR